MSARRTAILCLVGVLSGAAALAAPEGPDLTVAPVVVDGVELFDVRGVQAFPADERAAIIAGRIVGAARDRSLSTSAMTSTPLTEGIEISIAGNPLIVITDVDAAAQGVNPQLLARLASARIQTAIEEYRRQRTPQALARSALVAVTALAALAIALVLLNLLFRWLDRMLERRWRQRFDSLVGMVRVPILDPVTAWAALRRASRGTRTLLAVLATIVALQIVLGAFPWTRGLSRGTLSFVLDPLRAIGLAIVGYIPKAAFLVVLYFVVHWILRSLGLFFQGVERRAIVLNGFEPEWAIPTFRLVRFGVIALTLVIAYPYLPGSDSGAFKGVSLFLGVLLSLGATSAVSNIVAGYSLTYRRAFRVGDFVKVGEHIGTVTEVRILVTHLRTPKNEEVIVPNSVILNNEIVNYSTQSRTEGLILHTTVGIGYEVPWRQVEAMLLTAAQRTPGLKTDPPPFVLQTALGDFAITYELNVYVEGPKDRPRRYTDLHRNILDVFNEYGVQIMTPAYEGDPEIPKVVPKQNWFDAPATPARRDD